MILLLTASQDTYVTDKIFNNRFRVKDANLGAAATLDLFKLYGESVSGSDSSPTELSRILIKFDTTPLRNELSNINISHSSFNCKIKLFDVYGGQTCPSNFKLIVHPLSKSFDEGLGIDVNSFQDIGSCNFITSSFASGEVQKWNAEGASNEGFLGDNDLDIIGSGNLNDGLGDVFLYAEQSFETGVEDLYVDITKIMSATMANIDNDDLIPDLGFRIAYSGSFETNQKSYFVKRFASRHVSNPRIRPRIEVRYNDSMIDHTSDMFFDMSGSLFLRNFERGTPSNIKYPDETDVLRTLTGNECMTLRLVSGDFEKTYKVSQAVKNGIVQTGIYTGSILVSSRDTNLRSHILASGSVDFDAFWGISDGSYGIHTGSITIKRHDQVSTSADYKRLNLSVVDNKGVYQLGEKINLRVFVEDSSFKVERSFKLPRIKKSLIFDNMHYRIVDAFSRDVIYDFDTTYNSTKLSSDSDNMLCTIHTTGLSKGRSYEIEFRIIQGNSHINFFKEGNTFRLEDV